MVKQQADELDALKRIGLNLTSSLDLQTVLDTVVTEAMKLIKNARAAHIFYTPRGAGFRASWTRRASVINPLQCQGQMGSPIWW